MTELVNYPGRLPTLGIFTVGSKQRFSRHYVCPGYHRIDSYDYGYEHGLLEKVSIYSDNLDRCTTIEHDGTTSEMTGLNRLAGTEMSRNPAEEEQEEQGGGDWKPLGPAEFESQECLLFEWEMHASRRRQYVEADTRYLVAEIDLGPDGKPISETRWRIESREQPDMKLFDVSYVLERLAELKRP